MSVSSHAAFPTWRLSNLRMTSDRETATAAWPSLVSAMVSSAAEQASLNWRLSSPHAALTLMRFLAT